MYNVHVLHVLVHVLLKEDNTQYGVYLTVSKSHIFNVTKSIKVHGTLARKWHIVFLCLKL